MASTDPDEGPKGAVKPVSVSQENVNSRAWRSQSDPSEGMLSEYRRRKLLLAELIGGSMSLAAERHHEPAEEGARELLARLAEDRFQLAVVGQFSRGKSTLMNAILGDSYLPTGALPMTAVITSVRYGSRPRVMVRRRGAGRIPTEVSLGELARFVAQASSEREELQVASVDVTVPAEILRLGFHFIDTPGIGSAIAANTTTTERFLPDADAMIFVTSFDAALGEAELEFLHKVRRDVGRVFFVVNKLDLVSADEAEEIVRFVRHRLPRDPDHGELSIFPISAREALRARLEGDADRLEASGLREFERSLVCFLTREKSRSFLATMRRRAERLLARQRLGLEVGRANGPQDPPARERLLERFEHRIDELLDEQRRIAEQLHNRSSAELSEILAERLSGWTEELRERLRREVDERWPEPPAGRAADAWLRQSTVQLEAAGPALCVGWLTRRRAETRSLLVQLAGGQLSELHSLRESVETIAAHTFGASAPEPGSDPGWSPTNLPELATSEVRLSLPIDGSRHRLRPPRTGTDARARLLQVTDAAAVAFCESARAALMSAAERWVEHVALGVRRETRSSAERVLATVRDPASDAQVAVLERLERGLAAFGVELSAWSLPPVDESIPEPAPERASGAREQPGQCVVCARVADVPFRYMARAQRELARREEEREAHVRYGGFCAMHTWQYAELASDVGIATAYASLAERFARSITAQVARAAQDGALREALSKLAPGPDRCPACAALVDAERAAVRDLIDALPARVDDEPTPFLCVPHLAAVLAADPGPEHAARLAERLARTLVRLSEDMRAYSLKRRSLRGHLLSEEEDAAPKRAISYLAGRRELVRPWRRTDEIG